VFLLFDLFFCSCSIDYIPFVQPLAPLLLLDLLSCWFCSIDYFALLARHVALLFLFNLFFHSSCLTNYVPLIQFVLFVLFDLLCSFSRLALLLLLGLLFCSFCSTSLFKYLYATPMILLFFCSSCFRSIFPFPFLFASVECGGAIQIPFLFASVECGGAIQIRVLQTKLGR